MYNDHEELKDYDPKGEVYIVKHRRTSYKERLAVVQHCLKNKRSYKHTAEAYNVSYAQVHQWARKYDEHGEEGLLDRRGRAKKESQLSESEKLERENKRLRRENERLIMERDVLKKLQDVERRRDSQKSGRK